jgi:hypothetical protein
MNIRVTRDFREHIEPAIAASHDRITMDQVFRMINKDEVQIWFSMDQEEMVGAAVTQIIKWGSGRKSLRLILAGGKNNMYRNLEPTMAKLEEFARLTNCASVLVEGRKGWERSLPDGYKFSHATFEKELS